MSITGNSGINANTNFLGTTDLTPLRLRVNNIWAGQIHPLSGNVAIGLRSGINDSISYNNISLGTDALRYNSVRSNLIAIGDSAMFNNISGYLNVAIGSKALYGNTSGISNTAIGYHALLGNNGSSNVAVGTVAMHSNTGGSANTALGFNALGYNLNGSNNVALGMDAMRENISGYYNTAIGAQAMSLNTAGSFNTGTGFYALAYNSTGTYNVAIGSYAMTTNTSGANNVGIGYGALRLTTTAQFNTAIGHNAGNKYDLGYNNTILGANCDAAFSGCYNDISIGQGVVCTDNSMARIGNSATWSIGGAVNWTKVSDGRFKKDIKENVAGLDFIMKLRPVTYHLDASGLSKRLKENQGNEWNAQMKTAIADKEKVLETGFIAQEVEQAAKATSFEFSGVEKPRTDSGLYGLRYADFVVPLVKGMQEQQKIILAQQQSIDSLRKQVQVLLDHANISGLPRESAGADKLNIYPDPVSNNMTVTINTQTAGNGALKIFDSAGKLVKQTMTNLQQGMNSYNLSLPALANGYYTLTMDWGNGLHKQKSFVKTR